MSHERCLLTSVDEVLDILGETSKRTIYYHLEKTFSLPREAIPERPEILSHALQAMLGKGGLILQRRILTRYYERMDLPFEEHQGFTFADYVRYSRQPKVFVQTNKGRSSRG